MKKINKKPWGQHKILENGSTYLVKEILVKPRGQTSLHKHAHRDDYIIVVDGEIDILIMNEVGGKQREYTFKDGQYKFISSGVFHQLTNKSDKNSVLIEVETGTHISEDDIVRLN